MTTVPGEQTRNEANKTPVVSNLALRLITVLVVAPPVLFLSYIGGWPWTIAVCLGAVLGALEFYILARGREIQGSSLTGIPMVVLVVLAFHWQQPLLWQVALLIGALATLMLEMIRHPYQLRRSLLQSLTTLLGVFYIAFPLAFLVAIRSFPDGFIWLALVYALTWGTDTFAYLGGRVFGKTKLAPLLSPKKTVEGAVVGIIGGILPAAILLAFNNKLSTATLLLIGLGPLVAIFGDLGESGLKRIFQVKDSHVEGLDILPGHGGVLDRIDSLLLVAVLCYGFLAFPGLSL